MHHVPDRERASGVNGVRRSGLQGPSGSTGAPPQGRPDSDSRPTEPRLRACPDSPRSRPVIVDGEARGEDLTELRPTETLKDPVNHPTHYNSHPSGVECITVTEHMTFCIGNAIKYLWRAGLKGNGVKHVEDLKKACWYIKREIERLGGTHAS